MDNTTYARLRAVEEEARRLFSEKFAAREQALRLSREVIQASANAIRATHRGEYQGARQLLGGAAAALLKAEGQLKAHQDVYYAGFLEDAQKEFAEAHATLAFVSGAPLPGMAELGVGPAPYLNGLAEAMGEMRRYILDALRRDDVSRCEELLDLMDQVYTILVTMDFPEAVTRGLRRSTDALRGILERTRGDLTMALRQRSLEQKLARFEEGPKG